MVPQRSVCRWLVRDVADPPQKYRPARVDTFQCSRALSRLGPHPIDYASPASTVILIRYIRTFHLALERNQNWRNNLPCFGNAAQVLNRPAQYQVGTAPRTLRNIRRPGANNWTGSLFKQFRIDAPREGTMFEFRLESFKFLNTPQFCGPHQQFGSGNFGGSRRKATSRGRCNWALTCTSDRGHCSSLNLYGCDILARPRLERQTNSAEHAGHREAVSSGRDRGRQHLLKPVTGYSQRG